MATLTMAYFLAAQVLGVTFPMAVPTTVWLYLSLAMAMPTMYGFTCYGDAYSGATYTLTMLPGGGPAADRGAQGEARLGGGGKGGAAHAGGYTYYGCSILTMAKLTTALVTKALLLRLCL